MLSRLLLFMLMFGPVAPLQTGDGGVYVATYIDVQLSSTDQAIAVMKQYRDASRMEPGNSSIRLVQETARPNRFVIIEAWQDQSSFDAHERGETASRFRDAIKTIHNSPADQRVHGGFAIDPRQPIADRNIVVAVTHVDVPPQRTGQTEVLLKGLAEQSRKDEGNVGFEVFQQTASRNHFTVFEVWKDRRAFDSHEMKPHTRQFREALGPMLGAPYDERLYGVMP